MISIEERLKDLIKERYNSISEFSRVCGLPGTTIRSVLSRGIYTATLSNILKICEALHISADALANGEIEYVTNPALKDEIDVSEILANTKRQLLSDHALMFNGKPVDEESIQSIIDAMEVGMEIARRKAEKK